MKQKYYPKPPVFILVGLILSFVLSATMCLWWEASGTWIAIVLAIFFFLLFILCANPLVTWRTIVVDEDFLTVFKRFYKPMRVNITDSIYRINLKDNKVHLFLFKIDEKYFHIAPANYTKGSKLSEQIMAYVKKQDISVNVISG